MGRSFTRLFKIISLFIMFTMGTTFVVAQNCNIPTNVSTTNVLNFSATINWDVDTSVNRYRLRYREVGVGSWQYNHNVPSLGFFNLSVAISGASSFMVRNFGIKNNLFFFPTLSDQ